jgi:hypothetical protein
LAERIARLARLIGGVAALLYMLMLNAAEVGVPGVVKFDGGDIGEILRLNQNWVMYTPTPPRESGWVSVIGYEESAAGDFGPRPGEEVVPRVVDLLAACVYIPRTAVPTIATAPYLCCFLIQLPRSRWSHHSCNDYGSDSALMLCSDTIRMRPSCGSLRTGHWTWSDPAAVEEALSGIPVVPALLYKSSRWEKMFENYIKLINHPGTEPGWGCAAGRER